MANTDKVVNLRSARFDDIWRSINRTTKSTRLDKISFDGLSCITDTAITFAAGINAIIGANGTGKSTIAAAIASVLPEDDRQLHGHLLRLEGSNAQGDFIIANKAFASTSKSGVRVATEEFEMESGWFDSVYLSNILVPIHTDERFGQLLAAVEPQIFGPPDLQTLSYLVGRDYSDGRFYEIDEYESIGIFPYFVVGSGKVEYDTRGMGQGEFALFTLYWLLKRLPAKSILILEEPETHLSPRSQTAMMNILARFCQEKELCVIITTHSPTVVRRLTNAQIHLITHQNGVSKISANPSRNAIERLLGEGTRAVGGLVVEDAGAQALLSKMINRYAPELAWMYEILPRGGEGNVKVFISGLPKGHSWLNVVAILDGDQKTTFSKADIQIPVIFLPGDCDPDLLCQKALLDSDSKTLFANLVRKEEDDIHIALSGVVGLDHHEWPLALADALKVDIIGLRAALAEVWLSKSDNQAQALLFIEQLQEVLPMPGLR